MKYVIRRRTYPRAVCNQEREAGATRAAIDGDMNRHVGDAVWIVLFVTLWLGS